MSTAGAIFALLAITLIGGIVWYERSQPPAQVVALVAALAALAAAGRIALSPIPNVVPTTDITLIAGFALGGAPGFAVGALAALASNFWLGQGPWTPWQMAGWGMAGLLGAGLAVLTGRRLGRVGLAVACGVVGFAYGALLDLYTMVSFGGEQSLDRYLVLSARGLPFNVAHAAGNVAFALIAGPALVRMLTRYRTRFEFAWKKGAAPAGASLLLLLGAVVALAGTASPPDATAGAASISQGGDPPRQIKALAAADAVAYLRAAQNEDGGFGFSPDAQSSAGMTGWATLGLEAAGVDPRGLSRGGKTPLSYLRSTAGELEGAADLERTILVVKAAGLEPRRFAGRNLVRRLLKQRGSDGSWGRQVNPTAFGVLALAAAGSGAADRSASWLVRNRNDDGGWGFAPNSNSDADTTGAVLQALAASGTGSGADSRRRRLPALGAAFQRRLPSLGRRRQRAIDGLGDPGPAGRGGLAREAAQGRPQSVRLPRLAAGGRRPLPLLALQRPDPGLGHSAGPAGGRARSVPACRGGRRHRLGRVGVRRGRLERLRGRWRRRWGRCRCGRWRGGGRGGGGRREPGRGGHGSGGGIPGPLRDRRR